MKKTFFTTISFSVFALLHSNYAVASVEDVVIKKENGSVVLELPDNENVIKIYSQNELLVTSQVNHFELELEEEVENYKIDFLNEGNEIIDQYYLKIKNDEYLFDTDNNLFLDTETGSEDPQEHDLREALASNSLEAIINDNTVKLFWSDLPTDYPYEIFRDGELIGTTDNEYFIDDALEKGTYYNYQVAAALTMEEEYSTPLELELMNKGLTSDEIEEALKIEGSLNTLIEIPNDEFQTFATLPNPTAKGNFLIRYNTFIPAKSVKNPNPISNHNWFKGDNRGFSATSSKYRTRADVSTKMTDGNSITLSKSVGETVGCKDENCNTVTGRQTASSSGITMNRGTNTTSTKTWNVRHDIGIPFSKVYPNINYFYEATLKKAPSFSVNGAHDKAPNHEMYIRSLNGSTYTKLYTKTGGSFSNLIPGMPQQSFKFSY
ncbi:hypothetical protein EH196_17335 [Bacillus sp. C1-1]|nr:hypothetical protein EH196_17335 [Bacillus sp. C1-1]